MLGPSDVNGNPAHPKVTSDFAQPVATNDWWSSLIWRVYPDHPYSERMFAHPLAFQAQGGGLGMGYPTQVSSSARSYEYVYSDDLRVGIVDLNAPDTRVARYDDWSVTARWTDGARTLEATLGHGMPYAWFRVRGGPASVTFGAPWALRWKPPT